MKEIQKLNPPGLWQLKSLAALIDTMLKLIESGIGGSQSVLKHSRTVARLAREFRRKKQENLNIRIKAWVMQCPERIACVRGVIGEQAIKRWQKNRLADYAFTKVFGDWKAKFPNGLDSRKTKASRRAKPKVHRKTRPYIWKPFALQKIDNVEGFLYGRNAARTAMVGGFDETGFDAIKADFDTDWAVGIAGTPLIKEWSQPRAERGFKPVEFTPDELKSEAATGVPTHEIDTQEPEKLTNTEPEIFSPPKPKLMPEQGTAEKVKTGLQHKPP